LLSHGYPFYPDKSVLIRLLGRVIGQDSAISAAGYAFRFPFLMIVASLLCGLSDDVFVWRVLAPLVFVGMWIWMALLFAMRFVFGPVHTNLEVPIIKPGRWRGRLIVGRQTSLRFFITLYAGSFTILVLGYAAIYRIVAGNAMPRASMSGLDPSVPRFLEALYFSVTTLLTIGYGDITVRGIGGRLISISHMTAAFVMLVLLLSAFSASQSLRDSE
jgi:hypothetical protein